ncbi:transposase family protein [Streptomyces sp. NPDC003480]
MVAADGKKKQNTIKTTTFRDPQGRTLFSGVVRPGRMHDQTAVRTEGIAEQFHRHPKVRPRLTRATEAWPTSSPARPAPRRRSRQTTLRWASTTPGASNDAASPPRGSAWNPPTPSTSSGGPQRFTGRSET